MKQIMAIPVIILIAMLRTIDLYAIEPTSFSATVPTSLPIHMSGDGIAVTAENIVITNNSIAPIEVSRIEVVSYNGWNLVHSDTCFLAVQTDIKQYGMNIFGIDMLDINLFEPRQIAARNELTVTYYANISPQTKFVEEQIASVIFVLNWSHGDYVLKSTNVDSNDFLVIEEEITIQEQILVE